MNDVVITAALRTAVGKFGGTLAKLPASDLGAQVMKALLATSGVIGVVTLVIGKRRDQLLRSGSFPRASD